MAMFPPLTPIHPPTREFVFTEADFERVRNLIRRTAGIALNPLNPHASFLAVHYLAEHSSGERYFEQAAEAGDEGSA